MRAFAANPRAFSLIELVIVLAIAGVIGAIAVPRLSNVSTDAPIAAYKADLMAIQGAVDRYTAEHQGKMPDALKFAQQLTQYTDIHGNVSAVRTTTHLYGPYLRKMPDISAPPRVESSVMVGAEMTDGTAADEVVIKSMTNKNTIWMYSPTLGRVRMKVVAMAGVSLEAEDAQLQEN